MNFCLMVKSPQRREKTFYNTTYFTWIIKGYSVNYRLWVSVEDNTHFLVEYLSNGEWKPFSRYIENDVFYNRIISPFRSNIIDIYFTMSNKNGEPVHITGNSLKRFIGIHTGRTGQKECAIYGMRVELHSVVKSPINGKVRVHRFPIEKLHKISNAIMTFTPNNIELMGGDKMFLKFQREMCVFQIPICCFTRSRHSHTHTIVEYYYRNAHVRPDCPSSCCICQFDLEEKDTWRQDINFVQYPCKHSICKRCNDEWKQKTIYNGTTFTCPLCRRVLDKRTGYPEVPVRDMLVL